LLHFIRFTDILIFKQEISVPLGMKYYIVKKPCFAE